MNIYSEYKFLWLGKGRKGKKKSKNETSHCFICMCFKERDRRTKKYSTDIREEPTVEVVSCIRHIFVIFSL